MARVASRAGQIGLSLIEVVVVVAIVGVLALAVTPEIAVQLRNAQIRNAADAMQAGLQRARAEAISRNQNVRFSLVTNLGGDCALSATAGSWVVSMDNPDGKCDTTPDPTVDPRILAVHTASDGNATAVVAGRQANGTTAADSVTFNPFGRPIDVNQLARIVTASATSPTSYRSYRVDISAVGSVRMCDERVSRTSDDPRRCLTP